MKIGELASATGLSDKTIRYYEDIGVLPEPHRAPNGYRDYDRTAVKLLRFVKSAQAVGLTLGEIRGVISLRDQGQKPCAHVSDLITERAAEIDDKIAELQRLRAELRRLAKRSEKLDPRDCDADRICHIIGPA